jgi:hypothetical protein
MAAFIGEPVSVVQRWASEGMGGPDHAAVETTELTAELKRGLSYIRNEKQPKGPKQRVGKRTS